MAPIPRRVKIRPNPDAWSDTEEMSFAEAAALLWPDGKPYTQSFLRTCARQKKLETTVLARKLTTTKRAIREMFEAARRPAKPDGKI
ncbi:hypothetical protein [Bradyrhizobium sp. 143]|uniref:hypothetical protein n=1 Tax=Bradyrhizobium sp. 143 TaxID=2782619 RepID=UPI001FF734F4|nr:hypothetical protein [Bradyrhizobium sp. 143]MCK1715036.1 hypothetical protein [Bradyrhizobium sp. 143]